MTLTVVYFKRCLSNLVFSSLWPVIHITNIYHKYVRKAFLGCCLVFKHLVPIHTAYIYFGHYVPIWSDVYLCISTHFTIKFYRFCLTLQAFLLIYNYCGYYDAYFLKSIGKFSIFVSFSSTPSYQQQLAHSRRTTWRSFAISQQHLLRSTISPFVPNI